VGTGKNIPYYPEDRDITAIDIAPKMLDRARRRAERREVDVDLVEADAQDLPFADDSFESVVCTFVFCSVPDPVLGLREARRVLEPGGQLVMVEHVLSDIPILHTLMKWFDWLPVHVWGAHIDRRTVQNVRAAGFTDLEVTDLALDVVERIEGRAPEVVRSDQ
ncbi:MAG: class I SAM-dependent methyltransferase, partial [Bradymonadaceae bacterium]